MNKIKCPFRKQTTQFPIGFSHITSEEYMDCYQLACCNWVDGCQRRKHEYPS